MKTRLIKSTIDLPLLLRLCVGHPGCRCTGPANRAGRRTSRDLRGTIGGRLQGTWETQNNSDRLRRSRDKELPVTTGIRGGRHGGGVNRRDTAGSEDAWIRGLAPCHWQYVWHFASRCFTFNVLKTSFTGWTIISGRNDRGCDGTRQRRARNRRGL